MNVRNIHERQFAAADPVGGLIDSLGSGNDARWPIAAWPRLRLDRPLRPGAAGGHGPIRYTVAAYVPGQSVRFRFDAPRGFNGWHGFEIVTARPGVIVLRHALEMTASGFALLSWLLVFRPLHDALIEDSLARAAASLGHPPGARPWSAWVRCLRWLMAK